jgi:F-type H+/Na+-transporting ATPase subunit alpha
VELLKQPQYQPMHVADQVISIYAGTKGYLDGTKPSDVARVEKELHEYFRTEKSEVRQKLVDNPELTDEVVKELEAALAEYKKRLQKDRQAAVAKP